MLLELIDLKAILVLALIFVPLERLIPLRAEQGPFRKNWFNDAVYLLLNGLLIRIGFILVVGAVMTGVHSLVPDAVALAVGSQPLWLQTVEIIVLADIGYYLAHRAFHTVPFLWKFHAIHHSIEEMDWLATHRVHPVDQIVTAAISLIPVYAAGFSGSAVALFAVCYQVHAVLIHSNIRLDFGPLKWIFASPRFHHWHHANEPQAYDKNFAAQLAIIDVIAGTLFLPRRMPKRYGTDDPVPDLYHQQLVYPFRRQPHAPALALSTPAAGSNPT
jgi:sterol desaturase/sphingolipid hydroxylase (fatty acid hydroxylase superfamily)